MKTHMKIEIMTPLEKQQILHQAKAHSPLHFQHQTYFTALRIDSVIYISSAIAREGTINIIQKKLPAQLPEGKKKTQPNPPNPSPAPNGDTERSWGLLLIERKAGSSLPPETAPLSKDLRMGCCRGRRTGIDVSVLRRETGRLLNCLDRGYLSHFNPKFIPGPRNHCCYPTYVITSYVHQAC